MRPDEFHQQLKKQPFRPCRIHLSNGRIYEVRHPEMVMVGKSIILVGTPSPEYQSPVFEDYEIVSLLHINNLEYISPPPAPTTDGTNSD